MRMAVIALQFVEKRSDRYPYWRPNRGRAYEPIEPSNLPLLRGSYDARADPWESIDLPKIRRTIQAIVKNERLQGLRLFSAGFSAGASFTYTMAAAMPEIQGMLIMSQPSVNLNVYISQMAQQQRKFPPAAIVYHPMDAGRAKQNARDIQTLHEVRALYMFYIGKRLLVHRGCFCIVWHYRLPVVLIFVHTCIPWLPAGECSCARDNIMAIQCYS